jgi:hypothetical protein
MLLQQSSLLTQAWVAAAQRTSSTHSPFWQPKLQQSTAMAQVSPMPAQISPTTQVLLPSGPVSQRPEQHSEEALQASPKGAQAPQVPSKQMPEQQSSGSWQAVPS